MRPDHVRPVSRTSVLVMLALCAWLSGATGAQSQRRVFVTVLSDGGDPVTGLTTADFVVLIDGVAQEIASAAPSTEPLSIALLTDQLGFSRTYALSDLRQALAAFVSQIRKGNPGSTFSLSTFDGSIQSVTKFQSAPVILDRALARLTGAGEDAYLLDAIVATAEREREFPTRRRAVVVVVGTYRPERSDVRTDNLGQLLRASGASLWAVEALDRDRGAYPHAARELVLETATELSGGMREAVSTPQQLAAVTGQLANRLLAQYEIAYGPGRGTARSQLTVGVRRQNVTVLAPSWLTP